MPIAVYGNKTFQVTSDKIHTMDDLQYGSSLNTESQDSAGKKPSTYNKGPGLNSLSFKIKLDASLGTNPRREIEEWEGIKDAGKAYPFILGSRPFGKNKWLLVDIQASGLNIDNTGNILSAELSLKFDEYVRPGSAQASSSGNSKSYTPGIQLPALTEKVDLLGSSDKEGMKRYNPNMALYGDYEDE